MKRCERCFQPFPDEASYCPACGEHVGRSGRADTWAGTVVHNNYRLIRFLGEGGFGRVYLAEHLSLGKQVVVKLLHRALVPDDRAAERFRREARFASRLEHPNSIGVIDFGATDDGTLFFVMEYLEGRLLSEVIRREFPLESARIARICGTICGVLSEAHGHRLIHRDLKPDNIMLIDRAGDPDFVKVLDFGVATIIADRPGQQRRLTSEGIVCGTPHYMSPEQTRGGSLDHRSDIYSLGVILYEMLCGRVPFDGADAQTVMTAHLASGPEPPSRHSLIVDPELERICLKALRKDPAERYPDCAAMGAELAARCGRYGMPVSAAEAKVAQPAGASKTAGPVPRRLARPVVGVALLLLLGLAVALATTFGRQAADQPSAAGGLPADNAGMDVTPVTDQSKETGSVSPPSDGSKPPTAAGLSESLPKPVRPPSPSGKARPGGQAAASSGKKADVPEPSDPAGRLSLGRRLAIRGDDALLAGDLAAARRYYLRALFLAPSESRVWRDLGKVYRRSGEPDKALVAFRKYLAANPAAADRAEIERMMPGVRKDAL